MEKLILIPISIGIIWYIVYTVLKLMKEPNKSFGSRN